MSKYKSVHNRCVIEVFGGVLMLLFGILFLFLSRYFDDALCGIIDYPIIAEHIPDLCSNSPSSKEHKVFINHSNTTVGWEAFHTEQHLAFIQCKYMCKNENYCKSMSHSAKRRIVSSRSLYLYFNWI